MLKCKCDEFSFEIDTQQIFVKVFEMHQRYSAESMLNSWTLKKNVSWDSEIRTKRDIWSAFKIFYSNFTIYLLSWFYIIFSVYFRVSGQVPSQEENVNTTYPSGVPRELSLILKEIKVITDKIRDDEESSAIESDWKFAAMVLDRLCLITFTLFTIVATLAVLAAAPHVIVK